MFITPCCGNETDFSINSSCENCGDSIIPIWDEKSDIEIHNSLALKSLAFSWKLSYDRSGAYINAMVAFCGREVFEEATFLQLIALEKYCA